MGKKQMHNTVETAQGTVHYWATKCEDANAKTLVFTHGMGADHTMFDSESSRFSETYTVISWDVPLHGQSVDCGQFSYEQTVEALAQILTQEGVDQAILVGMSMGGHPSQLFAALHPERVAGLIALDTLPLDSQYYTNSDRKWVARLPWLMKWLPERTLKHQMAKNISHTKSAYDKTIAMLQPFTKKQLLNQINSVFSSFLLENRKIDLHCPVLILHGEHDTMAGVPSRCQAWANDLSAPLKIIPDAGHFSNGDNPDGVHQAMEDWLATL